MDKTEAQLAVEKIVSDSTDSMFEKLDKLHKRGINDDDVTLALRNLGHSTLARDYTTWQNDGEPLSYDEDGPLDQGEHLVTDPSDSETNRMIEAAALEARIKEAIIVRLREESSIADLYFALNTGDESLVDGYIDLDKLAAAVAKAVKA